ncbi:MULTISPECIES: ThiF family adenylyltransferase [unclassified Pseudomonas]|uniref:HesA/MoeB/ThiF family protein n=1 Tax=unclassified Pseudomonas TaxID=196821 RepID=UPI00128B5CC2|nr:MULTISPECIES: ThiF family adenylyltransferase [unclassified Pseudomonas]MPQ69873.1 ThiF family adenylyltransferase [Pseudomonas sp. MWU12-2323]
MSRQRYKLAKYVVFLRQEEHGIVGLGSNQQVVKDLTFWETLVDVSMAFINDASFDEIYTHEPLARDERFSEALTFLIDNRFLVPHHDLDEEGRYSRSHLYYQSLGGDPQTVSESLHTSSISIIGCGGIGNHISAMLACSGVGDIHLVDGDVIELSNLTRQILFSESDIGKKKTDVLATELRRRNKTVRVNVIDRMIQDKADLDALPGRDLFVVSADSFALLPLINQYCLEAGVPYLSVGYMNDISVYGPFVIPGETGCLNCGVLRLGIGQGYCERLNVKLQTLNRRFKSATFPPVNAAAAALASSDVLKYLGKIGSLASKDKRIGLHDSSMVIETQDFSANPECELCAHLH